MNLFVLHNFVDEAYANTAWNFSYTTLIMTITKSTLP